MAMNDALILLVEDERALADALAVNLRRQGFIVDVVHDGHAALAAAASREPDLIVLDVMLPGLDGFEVCRRIRQHSTVPILMLTARSEEIDRVLGLEIGADDYLTKPFGTRELTARIRALLRRAGTERTVASVDAAGDLRLSRAERRAWRGERELQLRPREFDLLAFLLRSRTLALTRQQILDGAWGIDFVGDERTVDVHVRALREAIEDDPSQPRRIVTVRGIGYRFEG